MRDTIFALSSGGPPAAIGVIRISGPAASASLRALMGRLPESRRATLGALRSPSGELLDQALVLWFPGPASATGEDCAELHCHGGRAVIDAVESTLARMPGLRKAEAGEFTQRAFANGRIDLAQAEGLADLLEAETQMQRSAALLQAEGRFSAQIEAWRESILAASAQVEALLDFSDEEDTGADLPSLNPLLRDFQQWLDRPLAESLKEGFRIALAGPPNAGKSTLFNALLEEEAAIASPQAGTTRDVLERSIALDGVPLTFIDMAGLRDRHADAVEAAGIERAARAIAGADLVLWLGPEGEGPPGSWEIDARCDDEELRRKHRPRFRVSAATGENLEPFKRALVAHAKAALPRPGRVALNRRQHDLVGAAAEAVRLAGMHDDPLLIAEHLRDAREAFDRLSGRASTEDMLVALFGRFCIGK